MRNCTMSVALGAAGICISLLPAMALAQSTSALSTGKFTVPASSIESAGDVGVRAHTNIIINNKPTSFSAGSVTPDIIPFGETPKTLRAFFGFPVGGGSQSIAIVDAFGWASAKNAFNTYSGYAGLPKETSSDITDPNNKVLTIVYQHGRLPRTDPTGGGWDLEQALDIEMAHAIAPNAHIYLFEADDNSFMNLFECVKAASKVAKEVSMSFEGSEFAGERYYDPTFETPGVVYFASSGDSGGPSTLYPSSSPDVVACGGVTLIRNAQGYPFDEYGWQGSTGGLSIYEHDPLYQRHALGPQGGRLVPDISFDADPETGAGVYVINAGFYGTGFYQVGGTSEACPALAAMVNDAGSFANSSRDELTSIYGAYSSDTGSPFYDPTEGDNGYYVCLYGYDLVTGVGCPLGETGL